MLKSASLSSEYNHKILLGLGTITNLYCSIVFCIIYKTIKLDKLDWLVIA